MNKQQITHLRRQRAQGFTLKSLCDRHQISMAELRALLDLPKFATRPKLLDEQRAIAQLRREGHSEEVIRANFG